MTCGRWCIMCMGNLRLPSGGYKHSWCHIFDKRQTTWLWCWVCLSCTSHLDLIASRVSIPKDVGSIMLWSLNAVIFRRWQRFVHSSSSKAARCELGSWKHTVQRCLRASGTWETHWTSWAPSLYQYTCQVRMNQQIICFYNATKRSQYPLYILQKMCSRLLAFDSWHLYCRLFCVLINQNRCNEVPSLSCRLFLVFSSVQVYNSIKQKSALVLGKWQVSQDHLQSNTGKPNPSNQFGAKATIR